MMLLLLMLIRSCFRLDFDFNDDVDFDDDVDFSDEVTLILMIMSISMLFLLLILIWPFVRDPIFELKLGDHVVLNIIFRLCCCFLFFCIFDVGLRS